MVGVYDDIKALLPRVAWLDVLDIVLRVEHEGSLLVARDLEILIGELIKDFHHADLDQ